MPNNYLVRPNQGVIAPNSQSKVTVLFNHKLDSPEEDKAIAKDKFQVLMALAPSDLLVEATQDTTWFAKQLALLNKIWTTIPDSETIQFKLRV